MKARLTSEAEAELEEAAEWYADRGEAVVEAFCDSVFAALKEIEQDPARYPAYEGCRIPASYRRALVKRFPYVIFFEILELEIRVVSVTHGHRRPGHWKKR